MGDERRSFEWYSIPRPYISVMLHKREEKNQKNMSSQRTLRESQKSMEASAILKMVDDAFYNRFFIIDLIVRDDDSTK